MIVIKSFICFSRKAGIQTLNWCAVRVALNVHGLSTNVVHVATLPADTSSLNKTGSLILHARIVTLL